MNVTLDFYEILKKGGGLLQFRINDFIQQQLNSTSAIHLVKDHTGTLTKKIEKVQNYVERTAAVINLPTKTDLSNATQLILQSEEKIDDLDEQIYDLQIKIQEIKELLEKLSIAPKGHAANAYKQEEVISALQQEMNEVKQKVSKQKKILAKLQNPIDSPDKEQ
ncbi:hypothetical protein [Niallia sp. NCCP-28]|uniref:hypothetical protein n=1 Tax=Niallia sp. NCCP-28 TaxID=2934712 RepID=UPI0020881A60|nr:hypothetical protein [Niallia sp. NCCP-28]GKU83178.1 hypothetical protein NCCP28_25740 [Niallia sp. NCCP-28]